MICDTCKDNLSDKDNIKNNYICKCGNILKIPARIRIDMISDEKSFEEHDAGLKSKNTIGFYQYDDKLKKAMESSGENEAVVTGRCKIGGNDCCIFVMEPAFMMGSMGAVVGEKITALFEYATKKNLSVVGFSASGGARMQEGMISLMQMAKTNAAVKLHSDAKGFFLSVLTDPTTGGVTASFATAADIIIAEPEALIGFAGQRVIKQTIRQELPKGFQLSEFALEYGMIDDIISRDVLKNYLAFMLKAHSK